MQVKLPIGIIHEGEVCDLVELKEPTGGMLRKVRDNLISGKKREMYIGLLSDCVTEIVGIGTPTKQMLLDMYNIDVEFIFFSIAQLDAGEKGPEVQHVCPKCGDQRTEEFVFADVVINRFGDEGFESPFNNEERSAPFTLSTPITTLDQEGTPYSQGKIGLMSYRQYLDLVAPEGGGEVKFGTIQAESILKAITELGPDWRGSATLRDLDKLKASDIKMIERVYNGTKPGIADAEKIECDKCRTKFFPNPIDWVADFFASNAG